MCGAYYEGRGIIFGPIRKNLAHNRKKWPEGQLQED